MSGERLRVALACVALSAAAVVPFHFLGRREADGSVLAMPATHDVAMHFDHMRAFWRGLAAGRLYPHWDDESNRGLGSPGLIFHPPAIYYLTSLVHLVAPSWGVTLLATDLLVMIAASAALYRYARSGMSRTAASVAMAAYIVLPYHLLDLYHRGAMAELLAFVWMPLVWLFSEECLVLGERKRALRGVVGLALNAWYMVAPETGATPLRDVHTRRVGVTCQRADRRRPSGAIRAPWARHLIHAPQITRSSTRPHHIDLPLPDVAILSPPSTPMSERPLRLPGPHPLPVDAKISAAIPGR